MDVWFLLFCKQRKDAVVEDSLLRKGYEVYRPLIKIQKRDKKGGLAETIESLFPRYLFLKVSLSEGSLEPVAFTPGVVGFVKFGANYSVVDESIINDIRQCEASHLMKSQSSCPKFKSGDTVYVNGDGFNDIRATFIQNCSDSRVLVLLKILGTTSKAVIPTGYVSKDRHCGD